MFKNINKNVRYYLLSNSFYYGGYDIIKAFLAILVTERISGGKVEAIGFILASGLVVRAVVEIPLSRLTRRLDPESKVHLVSVSYIVYGILVAALGFCEVFWQVLVIQVLISVLDAVAYPLKWTIFSKNLDDKNEELEWSLEDVLSVIITAILAAIGGIISDRFGIQLIFVLFGILFCLCGLTFHFIKIQRGGVGRFLSFLKKRT